MQFLKRLFARPTVDLGRKPVPPSLCARMVSLRIIARQGGRGSDIAAAELRGITTTIMELGR
jgi:hypothetical protein